MTDWKNRIIETRAMSPKELKANPKNWRKHPTAQQKALEGVLGEVGWVTQVIWNERTGHLIDGHLRVEMALKQKEKTVPVNVVDLSPEEEAMILATFDPIAAMAEADRQQLATLMQSIETEDEQIKALLTAIAAEERIAFEGETVVDDPLAEWGGMPEFANENQLGVGSIVMHFATWEDREKFAELVGQTVTEKTKYLWYPEQEPVHLGEYTSGN